MRAYTDGACRCGNPGETSAAWVVFQEDGNGPKYEGSRYLGPELHTNNYAEYQAMLHLLRYAEAFQVKNLDIFCDSKLVVEQVKGNWKVNEPSLLPFQREAHALFIRGGHTLTHIRGHQGDPGNEYVDRLCNEVLDAEFARRENVESKLQVG